MSGFSENILNTDALLVLPLTDINFIMLIYYLILCSILATLLSEHNFNSFRTNRKFIFKKIIIKNL